jgi:predicted amidophosphoribosyltransferase
MSNRYRELLNMDLIVPVPKFITELKQARNGSGKTYNQAMEISKVINEKTGISCVNALEKIKEQKMRPLSMDDRWKAVKGLYKARDKDVIRGKRVVLVDDVFTSGATVSECSDALLRGGAECVNVLVEGRDTG